jgi:hypothetical protein
MMRADCRPLCELYLDEIEATFAGYESLIAVLDAQIPKPQAVVSGDNKYATRGFARLFTFRTKVAKH